MSLSRIEQETIILFNEEEKTATVETCNKRLKKQLDQYCAENVECSLVYENDDFAKYVCPKSWVKVKRPRQLSSEQREKLAARARENFQRNAGFPELIADIESSRDIVPYDVLVEQIESGERIPWIWQEESGDD